MRTHGIAAPRGVAWELDRTDLPSHTEVVLLLSYAVRARATKPTSPRSAAASAAHDAHSRNRGAGWRCVGARQDRPAIAHRGCADIELRCA